ncbi:MAG: glycine--tRNA ligase subunit beta [Pseudomonadota bacterium]|nr:glycine--tRNA ligase subunit beta [Pseudomonadota bacterium]
MTTGREVADLLVEVGTEELPPKALHGLGSAFAEQLKRALDSAQLSHTQLEWFASPRRLAVRVTDLAVRQPDGFDERRGPNLKAAFDTEGAPTRAALGFARSVGVEVDRLEHLENEQGAWLLYRSPRAGEATSALLPRLIETALNQLPIPKRMRWGAHRVEFVRPVHWVLVLWQGAPLATEVFGGATVAHSRGHRFHAPQPLPIPTPGDYARILEHEGKVIAHFETRQTRIRQQIETAAAVAGAVADIDPGLLEEVTGLVEWPVALVGQFDTEFLQVPAEALISAMQVHQKYFPLRDPKTRALLPRFVAIANIESQDPGQVVAGNERVIRPRLADARFFFDSDRARSLAERRESLRDIRFQRDLGSMFTRTERLTGLARTLAPLFGVDAEQAERAAALCKSDLVTEMVGEFPELQGTMGRYYALEDGEPEPVATAIEQHYWPRHAGDQLPTTHLASLLAVADRLDLLVGLFGVGQPPSGTRDPFGLRRAALGVLRILIEQQRDLDLVKALRNAAAGFETLKVPDAAEQVWAYLLERFDAWYQDQGIAAEVVQSVLAVPNPNPRDIDLRIQAVNAFRALPAARQLAGANKRVANLLNKAADPVSGDLDPALLDEPAERDLAETLERLQSSITPSIAARDYAAALKELARLQPEVDHFFDAVMVMCDDPPLRANRLRLLRTLRGQFLQIADISLLPSEQA